MELLITPLFISMTLCAWDGESCGTDNNCCAQPGMPWFCRTLPQEVEGDIEVRICSDHNSENDEDVYIDLLEGYIQ